MTPRDARRPEDAMTGHKPTTTAQYRALEPEAAFQSWVMDYARARRWLVAHMTDSRRQDATGLPDLIMARGGVVILAELKTARGAARAAQSAWLMAAGEHGYLWRPSDRDFIIELLS